MLKLWILLFCLCVFCNLRNIVRLMRERGGVSYLPESPASTHHVSLLPPGRPCADEDMPFLNLIEILYYHYLVGISIFFLNCWTIPWSTKYQINQKFQNSTFFSYISLTWHTVPCMIMYRLRPSQILSKSIYLSSFSVFTYDILAHSFC